MRLFFSKYLRNWYWFVLAIGVALGSAYWYLRNSTPIYLVKAVVLVKKDNSGAIGDNIVNADKAPTSEKNIENEIETLQSRTLVQKVVDNLNLTVGYFKKGKVHENEEIYQTSPIKVTAKELNPEAYWGMLTVHILDKNKYELMNEEGQSAGQFMFNKNVQNEYGNFTVSLIDSLYKPAENVVKVAFYDNDDVTQQYQSAIKVVLQNQKSTVLQLSMETPIPAKGKAILRELLNQYTSTTASARNKEAATTLKFIDDRLRLITGELGNVEKNVESYKSDQGITDLSAEGNLFLGAVRDNDARLNDIGIQLRVLEGVEGYLKSSNSGVAPATSMVNDPVLSNLLGKLSELETQEEKYSQTTQPDNPYRKTVTAQIASTKSSIKDYVKNQRQNLLITQKGLTQQNNKISSSMRTIPRKEREYVNIKRQQAIKESLYILLLQKKEETAISYASSVMNIQVMDYPYSSPYPIKPNRSSIFMLAFFAGLLVPAGLISGRSLLNDKVQSRKEIETVTGIPVFGEITRKPKELKNNVIDLTSHTLISEQFKILRANIQHSFGQRDAGDGQVILITSSVSGEGKSFVSLNLALSMSLLNKKAIVLELDLRKPQIVQYLGQSQLSSKGISTYLAGEADYPGLIQQTEAHPNLYFIPSGPIPHNPTELLSNGRIKNLLDQLRREFDYIILDTPPVSMLADAGLLSAYADTALYVVRHEYTPRNYMRLLSDLRDSHKFKSLNLIVNAVNYPNSEDFGYGYSYPKRKAY
jgi:tyrosine-protein kinase Etk/Wzc